MFLFIKEIYLAEFTSFYKASSNSWTPGVNAGKGVAGVTLFEGLVLVAIAAWIEILVGKRFLLANIYGWDVWLAVLALYVANYYILVTRKHGIRFEREFNVLAKSKRIRLRIICYIIELTIAVFSICSFYTYQHFFHIVPKGW